MIELLEPLAPEVQAMLESLPDDRRESFADIIAMTQRSRVAHGYPANPPEPLTTQQIKEGEIRNNERAIEDAIREYGGKRITGWFRFWMDHGPVHFRDLPHFAFYTIFSDCWSPDEERDLVSWAWTECEFPEANLGTVPWRRLWARVGYLHETRDGESRMGTPPAQKLTLYRGAIESRKRGLAWSGTETRARWFAERFSGDSFEDGRVWKIVVPPERIYARFEGRGEDEWVIDARHLKVEEVE